MQGIDCHVRKHQCANTDYPGQSPKRPRGRPKPLPRKTDGARFTLRYAVRLVTTTKAERLEDFSKSEQRWLSNQTT